MIPLATAAISGIPELFKLGMGLSQAMKAQKLGRNTQRPAYQIPGALQQNVAMANQLVNDTRLPGQAYMENQIAGNTASGIRAIQESGGGMGEQLAAIQGLYGQQQNATNQLGMQAAQQQNQDVQTLMGANSQLAPQQQQAFQYNQAQPYAAAIQSIQHLREGANKNIFGGIQGLTSAAMMSAKPNADQAQQKLNMQQLMKGFSQSTALPAQSTPQRNNFRLPLPGTMGYNSPEYTA